MMTVQSDMNSAAAKTGLEQSMVTGNVQYYGNQTEMSITGQGHNPSWFSGSNPIQRQLSAANNWDSMMVENFQNPVCYTNQALPQPLPAVYPSTLLWQEQQSPSVYDPAHAHPVLPTSATATPNPMSGCINNNVVSLMPSSGNPDDTINFEQVLVGFRVVQPTSDIPPSALGNAVTVAPIRTLDHNQIIWNQGQHFLPQTRMPSFGRYAASANDGFTQMPKRRQGLTLEEAMNRKMRQIIKNKDSAARSRARKLAHEMQLQTEVDELRKVNGKLKKMLEAGSETKNGDKTLKRTNSWP